MVAATNATSCVGVPRSLPPLRRRTPTASGPRPAQQGPCRSGFINIIGKAGAQFRNTDKLPLLKTEPAQSSLTAQRGAAHRSNCPMKGWPDKPDWQWVLVAQPRKCSAGTSLEPSKNEHTPQRLDSASVVRQGQPCHCNHLLHTQAQVQVAPPHTGCDVFHDAVKTTRSCTPCSQTSPCWAMSVSRCIAGGDKEEELSHTL